MPVTSQCTNSTSNRHFFLGLRPVIEQAKTVADSSESVNEVVNVQFILRNICYNNAI